MTDTESDGEYPNYAWQQWEILTDDNQVNTWFQNKNTFIFFVRPSLTFCISLGDLIDYNLFQCIVITVGEGGFRTESFFDLVVFKDFGSDSGTNLCI